MELKDRLRESRINIGLTQAEFAELGGVKVLAQTNYERGVRFPTLEYLLNLKTAGIDIQFIIFGEVSKPDNLSIMDYKVLLAYQNASPERKKAIEFVAGVHDDSQDTNQRNPSDDKSSRHDISTKKNTILFSKYHLSDMKKRAIILLQILPIILLAMLSAILFSYVLTNLKFIENVYVQIASFTSFVLLAIFIAMKYTEYKITSYESNIQRLKYLERLFTKKIY